MLQTLRKNVMANGYAITEPQENIDNIFESGSSINEGDNVTGHVSTYLMAPVRVETNYKVVNMNCHIFKCIGSGR